MIKSIEKTHFCTETINCSLSLFTSIKNIVILIEIIFFTFFAFWKISFRVSGGTSIRIAALLLGGVGGPKVD